MGAAAGRSVRGSPAAGVAGRLGRGGAGAVALRRCWCGLQAVVSRSTRGPEPRPASITLGPPGSGQRVGATEYGGPGDPSSGVVGASGSNLLSHPDSYAELGGMTFQTATAMGGLAYMTPLRITWGDRSAVAYKRDFGFGGGPSDGLPRVIDLWWQLAEALGIPYEHGMWSGPVLVERPPARRRRRTCLGQARRPAPSLRRDAALDRPRRLRARLPAGGVR